MKKSVNKSELIRGLVAKTPGIKASEIISQLKKDGISVSAPLVYQTLKGNASTKAKGPGKKRGPKPKTSVSVASKPAVNDELFSSLQSFVAAAGGLDRAISILTVLKS